MPGRQTQGLLLIATIDSYAGGFLEPIAPRALPCAVPDVKELSQNNCVAHRWNRNPRPQPEKFSKLVMFPLGWLKIPEITFKQIR